MDNTFIAKIIFFFLISFFLWWFVIIIIKNLTSKLPPLKRVLIATYTICHLYLTLAFIASSAHMNFNHDDYPTVHRKSFSKIKSLVADLTLKESENLPSFINGLYEPNQIEILLTDDSKDLEDAKKYVESYPTLLKELEPILKSKSFTFPQRTKAGVDVGATFECSNFLSYTTNYHAYSKNKQKALEYSQANLKYANLILKFKNQSGSAWLAAMIPVNQSCQSVQNFITTSSLSEEELKSIVTNVPSTEKFLTHIKNSLIIGLGEISVTFFDNTPTAKSKKVADFYKQEFGMGIDTNYDQQKLARQVKQNFEEEIKNIEKPFVPYKSKEAKEGTIDIAEIYLEIPKSIKQRGLECITVVESTKLIVACKLFELKHGKLPQQLNDLVPEFIKEVPRDPFDHKPFRYNVEKKLIYSVGPNLIDSKGMTKHQIRRKEKLSHKEAKAKADLVFHLERTFKIR